MVARKKQGVRQCRVCRKPLPEKSKNGRQVLCINPPDMMDERGKVILTKCQVISVRRRAARAKGYGKTHEVQCEICLEFFMPDHPMQRVHKSEIRGEMSECEVERQRLYSEKYREENPKKSGYRLEDSDDLQLRSCMGRLCSEESNYPGELKFMSSGPYNRICERCKVAEDHVVHRHVTNSESGKLSHDQKLALV